MKIFLVLVFSLSLTCCISSCKKNIDEKAPVITISSPHENEIFSALDTVWITLTVEDETALKQVDITLTDENKTPLLNTTCLYPGDKIVTYTIPYELNDINMLSGNYYIRIRASDGTNIHDAYRTIIISEVPRELKYMYVLSFGNSTTIHTCRLDTSGSQQQLFDINGDFSSSATSSKFQMLYTCGQTYGDLNVYTTQDNLESWTVPVISNPPFPYFKNISICNDILYVSFYDGYIKGYNQIGTSVFTANAPVGFYPNKVMASPTYVFADHAKYSGQERRFIVYYLTSGAMKQQISTDYEVLGIFEKDVSNVFLFGNKNGQAIMKIYNIDDNGTWEPHPMPAERLLTVTQIDNNKYMLALESGLYFYNYSNNSLTSYLNRSFSIVRYDDVNSELYASSGNKIELYDYGSHTLLNTITLADSILDFQFLYNK